MIWNSQCGFLKSPKPYEILDFKMSKNRGFFGVLDSTNDFYNLFFYTIVGKTYLQMTFINDFYNIL